MLKISRWLSGFFGAQPSPAVAEPPTEDFRGKAAAASTRGLAHLAQDEFDAASASFAMAIALDPTLVAAHTGLGVVFARQGQPDRAIASFRRAATLDPASFEAHYNLGNLLLERGQAADALPPLQQAVALAPGHALAHYNLGSAFLEEDRLDEACASFRRTLALDPDYAAAHHNLRVVLHKQGRLAEAIGSYQRACALQPDDASLHSLLGMALLSCGCLESGWRHYEYRFQAGTRKRNFPFPEWAGGSLGDKALLVWKEQGIGDEIMFAGMFPELAARAGRCVIECTPKLLPLFARSFPTAQVVAATDPPDAATLTAIDCQCAAGSLTRWLRPTLDRFPKHGGYLAPDPERVAYWKTRLMQLGPGLKVGVCWRSGLRVGTRDLHYTRLDQWGPVFAVADVHFVNLQYDECADEIDGARRRLGARLHAYPEVDLFNDLDEAAALTQALDLVISAPTAAANMAAALGVPTWMMSYGSSWATLGAEHHPWFPAVRCFRLRWGGTWNKIIDDMARTLDDSARSFAGDATSMFALPLPGSAAADCQLRGDRHLAHGEPDLAAACYRRAIELQPKLVAAYLSLSRLLCQRDESDMAELLLQGGIALNPGAAALHSAAGDILAERGKLDEAIACHRQAHALAAEDGGPAGDAEACKNLGNAHFGRGELAAAAAR
jgi:tetratricopeptide (TPR) repeat protein